VQAVAGYFLLLAFTWAVGENRRAIPWRTVIGGLVLQILLALLLTRVGPAREAILLLNHGADALQRATDQGTAFLFGYLGGGALPFVETAPGGAFILAFKILPLVLVISALSALLFHWGVVQAVAGVFAAGLRRTLGIDGPLALAAAVHVFVGMIEAPLLIRPYLRGLQRIRGLCVAGGRGRGDARRSFASDHDLRTVRLRQPRQPRHPRRRLGRDGA